MCLLTKNVYDNLAVVCHFKIIPGVGETKGLFPGLLNMSRFFLLPTNFEPTVQCMCKWRHTSQSVNALSCWFGWMMLIVVYIITRGEAMVLFQNLLMNWSYEIYHSALINRWIQKTQVSGFSVHMIITIHNQLVPFLDHAAHAATSCCCCLNQLSSKHRVKTEVWFSFKF